jgi:sugar/nucleoside kinase (ribokinase family)
MLANLAPITQQTAIKRLKKRPKLIVMDTMNFWMNVALDDLLETIKLVDVLTINDAEARQLSGEYSLVKAANKILAMGPKYLIIKKGEHGALLFGEGKIFAAPALPLEEVFDPTGAGDTFAGGFIGYMAKTGKINFANMKNAVIYGSALASFCVETFGTEKLKNLTEEALKDRIQQFVSLAKFEVL